MKKKIFMVLSFMIITFSLSGCNIKFIEKAPEKEETTEEDTSGLGDVSIAPDDEDHMTISSSEESEETSRESFDKDDVSTSESSEEPPKTLGENQKEINGIVFDTLLKEVYAKEDIALFASADLTGKAAINVEKNTALTLIGLSVDKTIAMVRNATGSIFYVEYRYLTEKNPNPETSQTTSEQTPTPKPKDDDKTPSSSESSTQVADVPDPEPSTSTPQPQKPQENPVQTQPTQDPAPQPNPDPPVAQGGIPYPSNPSSTSINLGVTFADESFTATVVNTTTMNSGPGKVLNSTGYSVIETFEAGTTVNCTGIGNNGYIRVELANGTVGFILNTDLKR